MKLHLGVMAPALLACLLLAACDTTDPCPFVAGGRISGTVSTGGLAADATVLALRIVDGVGQEPPFETEPDAEGAYQLDVPAGRYVVQLAVGGLRTVYDVTPVGLGYGETAPDTLLVENTTSPVVIDFALGGVTFGLDVSAGLNGESGEIILHREGAPDTGAWRTYVDGGSQGIVDGRLDIVVPAVLPGAYRVEVVLGRRHYACFCPFDGEHFWLPGVRDILTSDVYHVAADSVLALTTAVATVPARISGRLTGAWLDLGLSPAPEISLFTPDSVLVLGRRRVDGDGVFGVDLQWPEPAKLAVTYQGFAQWVGGPGFAEATVLDLAPGTDISGLEVALGTLILNAAEFSAGSSRVVLRVCDPVDGRLLGTAQLDPFTGGNRLINLWPGEFLVQMSPAPSDRGQVWWRPQWYDRAAVPAAATPVAIAAGAAVTLNIVLEAGGDIAGDIALPTAGGQRYHIVVTSVEAPVIVARDRLSLDPSTFRVCGLADGSYRIGAVAWGVTWEFGGPPPAGTVWYPGVTEWGAATGITIEDAAVVSGLVIAEP